ncbi:MarR family winged helix-turn-helix transcriptional regulator [Ammoniphilus sp. YIM 78166]|uniref:MarR family winged helix-turn-helix transcriptional regulator n=1 Tax=Ammoniphilus sp. YIM 78166 TaxID=1644106 RepID=UPI0010702283|nr:MarR family transcriptional regulator [Ammoniphilus sp. YIM 78166]
MNRLQEIGRLLIKGNHNFIALTTSELSKYGITLPQAVVIGTIKDKPMTIGEISKAIDLSYSTVSGIVDRLERHGLVTRRRDHQDRRVVWVSLTDQLERLEKDCPILSENSFIDFLLEDLQEIDPEQIESLYSSLQLVSQLLEKKLKGLQDKRGSEVV